MKIKLLASLILIVSIAGISKADQGPVYTPGQVFTIGSSVSATCSVGGVFITTTSPAIYLCTASNVWTALGTATGGGVPSGSILLIDTGTCPTGFTEVSGLSGKFLRGTVAANGDVGGTGGNDNITPAGTNATSTVTPLGSVTAPTFTGNSVTSSAVSGGTPAGTNGTTTSSGNCTATNIAAGTGSTTACKATAPNLLIPAEVFTGSALGTHTHTTTATGTNSIPTFTGSSSTVGAQTFTGTQFDNRPAFTKVIYCKAN